MNTEKTTNESANAQMPLNRRQRRYMMKQNGMLKYLSKLNYFHPTKTSVREELHNTGRKIMQANLDFFDKQKSENLETIIQNLKNTWGALGYNEAEINMLEEAWSLISVKNKETYREDKKQAKQLMSNAHSLMMSRK